MTNCSSVALIMTNSSLYLYFIAIKTQTVFNKEAYNIQRFLLRLKGVPPLAP